MLQKALFYALDKVVALSLSTWKDWRPNQFAIHDLNLAAGPFETVMTPATLRDIYGVEAEFLTCRKGRPVILPLSAIQQH